MVVTEAVLMQVLVSETASWMLPSLLRPHRTMALTACTVVSAMVVSTMRLLLPVSSTLTCFCVSWVPTLTLECDRVFPFVGRCGLSLGLQQRECSSVAPCCCRDSSSGSAQRVGEGGTVPSATSTSTWRL